MINDNETAQLMAELAMQEARLLHIRNDNSLVSRAVALNHQSFTPPDRPPRSMLEHIESSLNYQLAYDMLEAARMWFTRILAMETRQLSEQDIEAIKKWLKQYDEGRNKPEPLQPTTKITTAISTPPFAHTPTKHNHRIGSSCPIDCPGNPYF